MRLRLFFDAGSGVCLWAQDEEAKQRFGYPVDLNALALPRDLHADLVRLIADYDATIDWDNPGATPDVDAGPTSFGYEPAAPLRDRVQRLLPRLRSALGLGFAIESDYEG
jgi:hypothetical protein